MVRATLCGIEMRCQVAGGFPTFPNMATEVPPLPGSSGLHHCVSLHTDNSSSERQMGHTHALNCPPLRTLGHGSFDPIIDRGLIYKQTIPVTHRVLKTTTRTHQSYISIKTASRPNWSHTEQWRLQPNSTCRILEHSIL